MKGAVIIRRPSIFALFAILVPALLVIYSIVRKPLPRIEQAFPQLLLSGSLKQYRQTFLLAIRR